jgi:hypothetical protein
MGDGHTSALLYGEYTQIFSKEEGEGQLKIGGIYNGK